MFIGEKYLHLDRKKKLMQKAQDRGLGSAIALVRRIWAMQKHSWAGPTTAW